VPTTLRRRARVNDAAEMLAAGDGSLKIQATLAERYGVSTRAIRADLRYVLRRLWPEEARDAAKLRARAVARLKRLSVEAQANRAYAAAVAAELALLRLIPEEAGAAKDPTSWGGLLARAQRAAEDEQRQARRGKLEVVVGDSKAAE